MPFDSVFYEIVRGFFESKVVQISTNPLFKFTSGIESPVYIDHRKIFSYPSLRKKVVSAWAYELQKVFDLKNTENLIFAGTATAGIAPAYALAEYFQAGFVYVRSKSKEHGLKSMIEGAYTPDSKCIVVDDMITTGGSVLHAVDALRHEKLSVLGAASISRHDFKKTNESFILKNVNIKSLFVTSDIFDIAFAKNFISENEMQIIKKWLKKLDDQ